MTCQVSKIGFRQFPTVALFPACQRVGYSLVSDTDSRSNESPVSNRSRQHHRERKATATGMQTPPHATTIEARESLCKWLRGRWIRRREGIFL
jgi:hypothetical protein